MAVCEQRIEHAAVAFPALTAAGDKAAPQTQRRNVVLLAFDVHVLLAQEDSLAGDPVASNRTFSAGTMS
jgi:hypothetical protein